MKLGAINSKISLHLTPLQNVSNFCDIEPWFRKAGHTRTSRSKISIKNSTCPIKKLTHVVIPRDENLAMLSSKLMPPTPITSIWSAGLFSVLQDNSTQTHQCLMKWRTHRNLPLISSTWRMWMLFAPLAVTKTLHLHHTRMSKHVVEDITTLAQDEQVKCHV